MTSTPMAPLPPRPGEPADPQLRDRYRTDASREREQRRAQDVALAAESRPSRTPVGPIRVIALLVSTVLVVLVGASMIGPMLKQSETTERALPAVTSLRFAGHVGDVRVRAAEPGESPKVVTTDTWGLWRPSSSVSTKAGVAQLKSSCRTALNAGPCSSDWLVVVPAGTDLTIEHGVGAINVAGIDGDIDVQSGVGEVAITDTASDRVSVEMGVGHVEYVADEPPRRLDLTLGVGDVSVRVPDSVDYRVTTDGASEVQNSLGSNASSKRSIRVEAGVGSVSIDPS